ncbi:MAG: alpha/beta hydrolase [Stenomitos rutilans HA7619-LM2]|jgi:predicted dienelactone hydrolase|nr:alpha/beta hydrolase [Stenomitos rutilans HA7619-LM2]
MKQLLRSFFAQRSWVNLTRSLSFGVISSAIAALPATAADRITMFFGPLQFSLSVDSLELYARQGKVNDELAFYTKRANPQQVGQLRSWLQQRASVSPVLISQITYTRLGEAILQQAGTIVQTDAGQNGFYALRAAFLLAAADPQGVTVVNVLRHYPSPSVRLDLKAGLALVRTFTMGMQQQQQVIAAVQQIAIAEATAQPSIDFAQRPKLQQPGSVRWRRQTFQLTEQARTVPVDLYLPERNAGDKTSIPLIVLLHGAASDRNTFAYLAIHLASHGFAVAVPESPGNSAQRYRQFLAGRATEPDVAELVNQPLDVKRLLDALEHRSRTDTALQALNLQQVGVMGHSQGGYAALALAGAPLNVAQLQQDCQSERSFNLALLVQCQALTLPPTAESLQDSRIKAVLAVNPITSSLLGRVSLSQIQVPTMLVAGSDDAVTPAVLEQIRPFTWLTTPNRYLVLITHGTHFSVLGGAPDDSGVLKIPSSLAGSDPSIARGYLSALSLAFFETHVAQQTTYRQYLSGAYARYLSQEPLPLSLLQSGKGLEAVSGQPLELFSRCLKALDRRLIAP